MKHPTAAVVLSVLLPFAAFAAGDLAPLVGDGSIFSTPPQQMELFRGERFAWVVKDKQMRFADHGITLGGLKPGEMIVIMDGGKITGLRISLYNRGDMGRMTGGSDAFAGTVKNAADELAKTFGAAGEKFERKTDPTKTVHEVEGLRWKKDRVEATLEWAVVPKRAGVGYDPAPEYLRLTILPPGAAAAASAGPGAARRTDPRSHVKRNADGSVELEGVPMVDQGDKGYCAAATVARVLGYYGLDFLDQHQVASWVASDPNAGTSSDAMMEGLRKVLHDRYKLMYSELACGKLDFHKLVEDYNKAAKSMKKDQIDVRALAAGGRVDASTIWNMMDTDVLRKIRCGNPTRNSVWMGEIRKNIDRGVPVVWSCLLGRVPEVPALPQAGGGHMRMIIGYTPDNKIVYTDSWGAGHERKTMAAEDAILITTGLRTIAPTLN